MTRQYTNKLLEMVEEGILDKDTVILDQEDCFMNLTAQEKTEVAMFGVTEKGMEEAFKSRIGYGSHKMSAKNLALSMISDAQTEMRFAQYDDARQTLNKVKWMLDNYVCAD